MNDADREFLERLRKRGALKTVALIEFQAAEIERLREVVERIRAICGLGMGTPEPHAIGKICEVLMDLILLTAQAAAAKGEGDAGPD